jgi:hypothetical protein
VVNVRNNSDITNILSLHTYPKGKLSTKADAFHRKRPDITGRGSANCFKLFLL